MQTIYRLHVEGHASIDHTDQRRAIRAMARMIKDGLAVRLERIETVLQENTQALLGVLSFLDELEKMGIFRTPETGEIGGNIT